MGWSLLNFSGEEILEIALQIEESGKTFYEKALDYAEQTHVKEMLVFLAQEEEKHIEAFTKLGSTLTNYFVPKERYAGEYEDYVRSLVNSHIFQIAAVEDKVKSIQSDQDILHFALSFERDSIVIFQEFKNMANKAGGEILERLIEEEKGHIRKINSLFHK